MKKNFIDYWKIEISLLFGALIFFFWNNVYPQALSYQEQYQLFLFTSKYFIEDISIAGGFADYVSEFLVQFYYIEWLGAIILSILFVLLQRLVWKTLCLQVRKKDSNLDSYYLLSFFPCILLLWHMGDLNVLLSYNIAIIFSLTVACFIKNGKIIIDIIIIPVLFWLLGPAIWIYTGFRILYCGRKSIWTPLYLIIIQFAAYFCLLQQWPLSSVLLGINYYRIPMETPTMEIMIPVIIIILIYVSKILSKKLTTEKRIYTSIIIQIILLSGISYTACCKGYDSDIYELTRQDYLIRNERWNEIIQRAQNHQVETSFSSVSVNLALGMTRQLADRMFDFYQSGEDALLMPMIRDLTSDLPTAEVFYRLGMINSAQRYIFDIQESILNAKKSGRCTKRIIECCIINGKYKIAKKHIDLLKKSFFYHNWACDAETYLYNEAKINAHPTWGKLRKLRYKKDFLFNYKEIDKMLGLLFVNNPQNKMALDYFMGEMLLKGNIQGFQQYLIWSQQYGGYSVMPLGYQDAIRCIQSRGDAPGSAYARYVQRMIKETHKNNE